MKPLRKTLGFVIMKRKIEMLVKSLALERASGFAFSYHKQKPQQPPRGHGGH